MEFIYVGEVVTTHGIKGELRLRSDLEEKKELFKPGRKLYVGKMKEEVIVVTYRTHKNYDMITLEGMNNINDVLPFKGEFVYVNRSDLNPTLFMEDYLEMEAYVNDRYLGKIVSLQKSKAHDLFEIKGNGHYYVPKRKEFIEAIDQEHRTIHFVDLAGLFDEN